MTRGSVLDKQSIRRDRKRVFLPFKRALEQLGFGLIKIFVFILALIVVSSALLFGYRYISSSPYLRLNNIIITGVNGELKDELMKISGIKRGESYLSINVAKVKQSIEEHPWVKSAKVEKKFPHAIHIGIESREAAAIVISETDMHFMDTYGVIFKRVENDDFIDFPVITGMCSFSDGKGRKFQDIASLLNLIRLEDAPLSIRELSEINVSINGDLALYFSRLPFKVFIGKDDFKRKIKLMRRIVSHLTGTYKLYLASSIDLDYSNRAVVAF